MSVLDGFKYVYVPGHEERLYNLKEDPDEYVNLIGMDDHREIATRLRQAIFDEFDPYSVAERALTSQRNRGFIFDCARSGEAGG
jgi:hypothetical protein